MDLRKQIADAGANARWVSKMGTGGVLLDLGANIGEVALRSKDQFDKIICIEADPKTAEIAAVRLKGIDNVVLLNQAVVPDGAPEKYWVSNPSVASVAARAMRTKRFPKRDYYLRVDTVSFSSLLSRYRPRCVKMDIEADEFDVLGRGTTAATYTLLENVECMVVEFHRSRKEVPGIVDRLRESGLSLVNDDAFVKCARRDVMALFFRRRLGE